jgi:tetratricopeptide (TPR) repeat protein
MRAFLAALTILLAVDAGQVCSGQAEDGQKVPLGRQGNPEEKAAAAVSQSFQAPGAESSPALAARAAAPGAPALATFSMGPLLTNDYVAPRAPTVSDETNSKSDAQSIERFQSRLETARQCRREGRPQEGEPILTGLLEGGAPESIQQLALFELAIFAQEQGHSARAQQICAQFIDRWPNASLIPEVLLRQGVIFRQMGLNNLALAKFYSVMTSSLVLKNDTLDYYQGLVLLAQTEVAETHFQLGRYAEAADFFTRLLKQSNPALNRVSTQFRLVRALAALNRNEETVAQGKDFLLHFTDKPECPEVRFHVSLALKKLGRKEEALQQVLALLQEQRQRSSEHPELWTFWQQRAGNEIGNQLYREGDYANALGIYLNLAKLDNRPDWQLPVLYQIGLTYERLSQPEKARQSYQSIMELEPGLGTNASSNFKTMFEMARWRASFVQWHAKAESRLAANSPEAKPDSAAATPPGSGLPAQ